MFLAVMMFVPDVVAREPLYGQHFPATGSIELAFTPGDDIDLTSDADATADLR